jgi:hypothetical protein
VLAGLAAGAPLTNSARPRRAIGGRAARPSVRLRGNGKVFRRMIVSSWAEKDRGDPCAAALRLSIAQDTRACPFSYPRTRILPYRALRDVSSQQNPISMIMAGRARMLDDTRRGWKKEAMARCHEIVARTEDNQRVTGEDDVGFLHWLLGRHPRASQKIGVGVVSFTVQPMERGTRGFVLHRHDGSSTDFSYYSCITPPNGVSLARKAMRRAVDQQISEFRKASAARGPFVCEVTGEALRWDDVHVDHAPPSSSC